VNAYYKTLRRVFLLRHGHVDTGGQKRYIGRTDLPLSPLGQDQAERLAEDLASSGADRIVSSDLRRAHETARIIASALDLNVHIEPSLREIDLGAWDGRTIEAVRREDPEAYRRRGEDLAGFQPPGGESFGDLSRRVAPAMKKLAAHGDEPLIVVAHAGVNRVLLCRLLSIPLQKLFSFGQDCAAINIIDYGGPEPVVRAVNRLPEVQRY